MSSSDEEDEDSKSYNRSESDSDSVIGSSSEDSTQDKSDKLNRTADNNEGERKAAGVLLTERNALNDVALIHDIFNYVDQTSRRITQSLLLSDDCKRLRDENERLLGLLQLNKERNHVESFGEDCFEEDAVGDNDSITWSQYEELNDGQRAQLLEKSLQLLNIDVKKMLPSEEGQQVQKSRERKAKLKRPGGK